ncbi:hypothetical protein F5B20DRAFT_580674 [Whalleya microplaca]|nr:hypothetical protein F5B20DRAFT_580674 [Whalleya microplaca]
MAKKDKKDKKSGKEVKPVAAPLASTSASKEPPAQLMDLVENFLSDQGFANAHREFQKHRVKKGWKSKDAEKRKKKDKSHQSLVGVFRTWETFASQNNTPIGNPEDPMEKITRVSSSSSSESDSDDSSSESDSDSESTGDVAMEDVPAANESSSESSDSSSSSESSSDSESESESEEEAGPSAASTSAPNPLKRKAESDSESSSSESDSDSDSDMSDSSSGNKRPQTKKAKTQSSSDESSSSSSSSSDDESSDEEKPKAKEAQSDDDSSSSSESDSDSDSEEEPEVDLTKAAQVPLPESESESSSDSESEAEDKKPQLNTKDKAASNSTESRDTSVTLEKTSPEIAPSAFPPLPPDPTTLKANNRAKNGVKTPRTQNEPFSRIRKDVLVDPRMASNAYVSHEYGEKAHQDLIVTKGKGFTKEKNKKKRGSYKGGPLDIHQSRSIKFDD